MRWVIESARAVKVGSWIIGVILIVIAVIGVADRYHRQRALLLEGQQALLAHRSSWGYDTLVRQLATHELQLSLLRANPLPTGCLPDQSIAEQQRATETLTEGIEELTQYTSRVPINHVAALPSPLAPQMRLTKGGIQMTSRQLLGYSCSGRDAVIRETQTRLHPLPLPPRSAIGPAFVDALVVHVAVSHGHTPPLYVDIRFTGDKADLIPVTAANWPTTHISEEQGQERFVRDIEDPQHALHLQFYSEILTPNFLSLFLSWNGLGLSMLVGMLASVLLIIWLSGKMIDAYGIQHRAATRDFLTGLYNRREAMALAEAELARVIRTPSSLCILLLDIDHFKRVNDTYGHDGGDEVLKFFAQLLNQTVRQHDLVARIGGEEFLILLPNTDLTGAHTMAERLLQILRDSTLDYAGTRIGVTCSIGVTAWRGPEDNIQAMLIRADLLLYQAKQQGRDRYVSD
ncbi:diguanylate cyclase (GGDEF) domain-containing protein [Pseudomonas sp. GM21]|jgi:diguanylate cyclase (GGDEF)-like protein|nr:diguanylate cyclase (GGDEF) domain-containing protein [Pseudomonas sp. GM21]